MFKYSSIKIFFLKFFLGTISVVFAVIYIASLISYSQNDPGFGKFIDSSTNQNISNIFGIYGAYISSYSLIIFGSLRIVLQYLFYWKGLKSILGINSRYFILKFTSSIIGIVIISYVLQYYNINFFNKRGLISIFISNTIFLVFSKYLINSFLIFIINLFFLVIGLILIGYSLSLKFNYIRKLFCILYIFKIFKVFYIYSMD